MTPEAVIILCICAFIAGGSLGMLFGCLWATYWPIENANHKAEADAMRDAMEAMRSADHV